MERSGDAYTMNGLPGPGNGACKQLLRCKYLTSSFLSPFSPLSFSFPPSFKTNPNSPQDAVADDATDYFFCSWVASAETAVVGKWRDR